MDEDALDILRLLRGCDLEDTAHRISRMLKDPISAVNTTQIRTLLEKLFGAVSAPGPIMAARAAVPLADEAEISESCVVLTRELLTPIP